MNKNLIVISSFKVLTGRVSQRFQRFMEEQHFPKMKKTDCFHEETYKIKDTTSEPGYNIITYINQPLSSEKWKQYNENPNFRPVMKAHFIKENGEKINKEIFPIEIEVLK